VWRHEGTARRQNRSTSLMNFDTCA